MVDRYIKKFEFEVLKVTKFLRTLKLINNKWM